MLTDRACRVSAGGKDDRVSPGRCGPSRIRPARSRVAELNQRGQRLVQGLEGLSHTFQGRFSACLAQEVDSRRCFYTGERSGCVFGEDLYTKPPEKSVFRTPLPAIRREKRRFHPSWQNSGGGRYTDLGAFRVRRRADNGFGTPPHTFSGLPRVKTRRLYTFLTAFCVFLGEGRGFEPSSQDVQHLPWCHDAVGGQYDIPEVRTGFLHRIWRRARRAAYP
jgi:hypothetical protein